MENQENSMQHKAAEETAGKPYTLRPLKDGDLFPVLDIIGKVMPDELASTFAEVMAEEKGIEEIGSVFVAKLLVSIVRNMGKIHDELYTFLSSVSGIPAAEIEEMEFGTTPAMLWDIVSNAKNTSFFKVVSKLL